jgi:hypothetical protein
MAYRIGFDLSSLTNIFNPLGNLTSANDSAAQADAAKKVAAAQLAASKTASDAQLQAAQTSSEAQLAALQLQTKTATQQMAEQAKALLGAQQYAMGLDQQLKQQQLQNAQMMARAQADAARAHYEQLHAQDMMRLHDEQLKREQQRAHQELSLHDIQQQYEMQMAQDNLAYYQQFDPSVQQAQQGAQGQWGHIPGDDDRGAQYGIQLSGYWY